MHDEAEFGVDDISEEEYNKLKEKTMTKKKKTKTASRKKKQFGGGFNQPLAGARAPIRPLGFKHGKSAKK